MISSLPYVSLPQNRAIDASGPHDASRSTSPHSRKRSPSKNRNRSQSTSPASAVPSIVVGGKPKTAEEEKTDNLISLLNRFNAVYTEKLSPDLVIEQLKSDFKLLRQLNGKEFITSISHPQLGLFEGKGEDKSKADLDAKSQVFSCLKQLSEMFSSFKSLYSNDKNDEIMDIFLAINQNLISVKISAAPKLSFQATLGIKWLESFGIIQIGKTLEEGKKLATQTLFEFLKKICFRIETEQVPSSFILPEVQVEPKKLTSKQSPISIAPKSKSSVSKPTDDTSFSKSDTSLKRSNSKVGNAVQCPSKGKGFDYLVLFQSVTGSPKSAVDYMNQVIALEPDKFSFTKKRSYDKKEKKQYDTCLLIEGFCNFTAHAPSKNESKKEVLKIAYEHFAGLTRMLNQFRKRDLEDTNKEYLMLNITWENEKILKLKFNETRNGFQAILLFVRFVEFQAFGKDRDEAQRLVFEKMYPYIKTLVEKLDEVQAENLKTNEKEVAVLDPSDTQEEESPIFTLGCNSIIVDELDEESSIVKLATLLVDFYSASSVKEGVFTALHYLINDLKAPIETVTDMSGGQSFTSIKIKELGVNENFCACSQNNSKHQASQDVYNYLKNLLKFAKKFHLTADSPLENIKMLNKVYGNLEMKTAKVNNEKELFVTWINFARLRNFVRVSSSEFQSQHSAALAAIEYIKKLSKQVQDLLASKQNPLRLDKPM